MVYLVFDRDLEREVALKIVQIDFDKSNGSERLRREAKLLAQLDHPGIVPVYDVGCLSDGSVYYTMKFVEGQPFDVAVDPKSSLAHKLRIFRQVCATVGFAHSRGVVHLDLKPQNVLVAPFGEILVVDWGIARALGKGKQDTGTAGTPGFMAPEQLQSSTENISPRTDVFALGRMLQLLLPDLMREGVAAERSGPRARISRALRAICDKALSENPNDRYPSAFELTEEVTRFLDLESVEAYRESWSEAFIRWIEKNRALVYLILTYLFMRLVVAFLFRN